LGVGIQPLEPRWPNLRLAQNRGELIGSVQPGEARRARASAGDGVVDRRAAT
jgi:hypothetical protein